MSKSSLPPNIVVCEKADEKVTTKFTVFDLGFCDLIFGRRHDLALTHIWWNLDLPMAWTFDYRLDLDAGIVHHARVVQTYMQFGTFATSNDPALLTALRELKTFAGRSVAGPMFELGPR